MAEPLSTIAGIISLADVTVRACSGINSFTRSWKDAPRSVKSLHGVVAHVDSTIASLKSLIQEYSTSLMIPQHGRVGPESIAAGLDAIKEDLILLNGMLPSVEALKDFHQKASWGFKEERVMEIVHRLGNHQASLNLGLQIIAQYVITRAPNLSSTTTSDKAFDRIFIGEAQSDSIVTCSPSRPISKMDSGARQNVS